MNALVTLADVLSQPLPKLLTAAGLEIVTTDRFAAEHKFLGAAVERPDGSVFLLLPNGRDEVERDCIVRGLIAALSGLDTSRWPKEIRFSEDDGRDVA
ncbi:MAG: hypothetical protein JWO98_4071 [Frankiales bacterium]|nr:hypothetical protein [Frankiales bacterium]